MNNNKVTKAVIPCAGLGTRFLPYTKASAKELIAVVDKPALQYIVEEAVASGITDICLVINSDKQSICRHFSRDEQLENTLRARGHSSYAELVEKIASLARFSYVYQEDPKGSADAVYLAKDFVGDDPFALLFGDDLVYTEGVPPVKQLIDEYLTYQKSVLGVQTVLPENISKYGSISIVDKKDKVYFINDIIEKPKREEAPSLVAALGRYVLSPEIFDYIEKTPRGVGGEYQITDTFRLMAKDNKVIAREYDGRRYDTGNKNSYLEAVVEYALRDKEIGGAFKTYLKSIMGELNNGN